MTFNYTICYPNKEKIETSSTILTAQEVLDFAENHPWVEQNNLCIELPEEQIFFSPSLEFINTSSKHSLTLTADFIDNEIRFALWFNRPKKVKIFFGLFGEHERMEVDDVGTFTLDEALKYLEHFVNGNYSIIEDLYLK